MNFVQNVYKNQHLFLIFVFFLLHVPFFFFSWIILMYIVPRKRSSFSEFYILGRIFTWKIYEESKTKLDNEAVNQRIFKKMDVFSMFQERKK